MGAVLAVDQARPSAEALARAAETLRSGGVLVMPTDSVYGIGCAAMPHNPAHERIFDIKRRDRAQTLPWLVADLADLARYAVDLPVWAIRLAERLWPGALTLVVRAAPEVAREYLAEDGTLALRVPDSPLVRAIAREVGPLATTSANTHGAPSAASGSAVEPRIVAAVDLTLDAGPAPLGIASTIVDATGESPRILREGAISVRAVLAAAAS